MPHDTIDVTGLLLVAVLFGSVAAGAVWRKVQDWWWASRHRRYQLEADERFRAAMRGDRL